MSFNKNSTSWLSIEVVCGYYCGERLCSGGPTEIQRQDYKVKTDSQMAELDVPQTEHVQQNNLEVTESIENEWPDRAAYHMNSRRLKMRQLRWIAAALGVTAESASAEDIRTIIEGKLRERDKNPTKVQVIVQDSDGMLFLINDDGVILTVEAVIDSHVIDDEVASSRSTLRSGHVSRHSSAELNELETTVEELRLALQSEKQESAALLVE